MTYTKEQVAKAIELITPYRGKEVYAIVNSVSRSGMSRRIELYCIGDGYDEKPTIDRVGWLVARITGESYDADKGGIRMGGCGSDMIHEIIALFNYRMADIEGKTAELRAKGERIYDSYFFSASYRRL